MRAVLRYHGAKWRLAPEIIRLLPRHRVYVEPFGGSAAVLLSKPRAHLEVYNDADSAVVRFFRVLREQPGARARQVALTPFSREEFEGAREPYEGPDDIEAARRFVVRSWQGRGGYQANKRNAWWVQGAQERGGTTARAWDTLADALLEAAARLKRVCVEHDDWFEVARRYDGDSTLHYLDPPYLGAVRGHGRRYVHDLYAMDEHAALLEQIKTLRGMVVLSGYAHPLYDEALAGWHRVELDARSLAGSARTEVVWLSPSCPAPVRQAELFTEAS